MKLNLLLQVIVTCCLLIMIRCQSNVECQMPTESAPFSMCSFCTDSHAGVRWSLHESNAQKYPFGVYGLDIRFICNNTENLTTNDNCFDGDLFPAMTQVSDPSAWHWHFLGQTLSEGTECTFIATTKDAYFHNLPLLMPNTSCTVHGNNSTGEGADYDILVPAMCSEANENKCSCQCGDGFMSKELVNDDRLFTCTNRNECSEGTHDCIDGYMCVDLEGSYSCINATENYTAPLTVVSSELTLPITSTSISTPTTIGTINTLVPPALGLMTSLGEYQQQNSINKTAAAALVVAVLFVILITCLVTMALILLRKKKLRKREKITTIPSHFTTDDFDPDFCPIDIDKYNFSSLETVSFKSVLHPLNEHSFDDSEVDMFSITNSIGSTLSLNYSYIDY